MKIKRKSNIKFLQKTLAVIILLAAIVVVGYWAIYPDDSPLWTGFGAYDEQANGPRAKTLWDWFELLIIPIFLIIGAGWLNKSQKDNEREIETDRQRQTTLDAYLNCMTDLLLKEDLQTPTKFSIARTRTLTVLHGVDDGRKAQVLQFLYEAGLIDKKPDIPLTGANLQSANLDNANLSNVEIRGTYFNNCSLRNATLVKSDLRGSDFSNADLTLGVRLFFYHKNEFANHNI